jgi:hypothetical protein
MAMAGTCGAKPAVHRVALNRVGAPRVRRAMVSSVRPAGSATDFEVWPWQREPMRRCLRAIGLKLSPRRRRGSPSATTSRGWPSRRGKRAAASRSQGRPKRAAQKERRKKEVRRGKRKAAKVGGKRGKQGLPSEAQHGDWTMPGCSPRNTRPDPIRATVLGFSQADRRFAPSSVGSARCGPPQANQRLTPSSDQTLMPVQL